jgi:zinc protease
MADLSRSFAFVLLLALCAGVAAQAPKKAHSIEGITEWQFANGLKLLTLPDPGADTVTVHITYLVGSRHEGYGEKGMAHLLEHLLFKGSKRHPNLKEEFTHRGGRWNGTTSNDRTNYFETLPATDDNLEWAIAMEADRMVNSFVSKQDLDSEMTVVRNEFELGENNAGNVLFQRVLQLAFPWHNYGNATVGQRADIERMPIDKLQAFYRTWYQPDNAVLIVAGRFDEARAVALVGRHFAPIPRPARVLPAYYTDEPTQDGERRVRLERVGDNPMLVALYRAPAGSHPDFPALDVLANVLAEAPGGRLHRGLVQPGIVSSAWGTAREMHDPGYLYFGASLGSEAKSGEARERLLGIVEGLKQDPVRAEELERARTALLNDVERALLDTGTLVRTLSEYIALGDWRLLFLYRDRLRKVTLADVQRVAGQYLRPANRVLGEFVPTERPERAEIPPTPDLQAALQGYAGGASVRLGEAFDASPQNIDKRTLKRQLSNGIRAALLPKQTRGGRVVATLALHWGDEKSLFNRDLACGFAGGMLQRGTQKRSRAELKQAFDALNASVSISGDGASIEVRGENLIPALRLAAEALREPSFPRAEFEEMRRAALSGAEAQRNEPSARASVQLSRRLHDYPSGHPHYTPTLEERIGQLNAVTLEDAVACYRELFGATGADFVAVGDFDAEAVARAVDELFGPWATPHPFQRVPSRHFDRGGIQDEFLTPEKANAALRAGINVRMRDDHPDFPALVLANHLLGGSSTARVPARVREKEGLSYSTYTSFTSSALDESAAFRVSSTFAPQNRARVERAIREELERAVREGFSVEEIKAGKNSVLEARRLARSQDRALAGRLGHYLFVKRTFAWDVEFEKRIAALTPQQVNAALRRHLDPARLSVVVAGDLKK